MHTYQKKISLAALFNEKIFATTKQYSCHPLQIQTQVIIIRQKNVLETVKNHGCVQNSSLYAAQLAS